MTGRLLLAAGVGLGVVAVGFAMSFVELTPIRWIAFMILETPLLAVALVLEAVGLSDTAVGFLGATLAAWTMWSGVALAVLAMTGLPRPRTVDE